LNPRVFFKRVLFDDQPDSIPSSSRVSLIYISLSLIPKVALPLTRFLWLVALPAHGVPGLHDVHGAHGVHGDQGALEVKKEQDAMDSDEDQGDDGGAGAGSGDDGDDDDE